MHEDSTVKVSPDKYPNRKQSLTILLMNNIQPDLSPDKFLNTLPQKVDNDARSKRLERHLSIFLNTFNQIVDAV
jgi:hypothetical protein